MLSLQQTQYGMSNACPNCGSRSFLCRSSPFRVHLGTCIAFDTPEPDRRAILQSVHDIEQDMTLCRERIAHLTEVLSDLHELRTAHIKLFPPVHTLPVEVLLKIFELSVKKPYPFNSIQDGPWHLGHVCRLWRQITTAPSSLWSSLSFRTYLPGSCSIPMLRTVFERSSPLSFDVQLSEPVLDIVKSHSLRWYGISIFGPPKSYAQLGEVGELPLLATASLQVSCALGIESYSFAETLHMFRLAPRLRSLKLQGIFSLNETLSQSSSFPWHQLTHLETRCASTFLHDCQLFSLCPNLLSYTTTSFRGPGPSESVLHSNLNSLNLVHFGLLHHLRCKSLTELRFTPKWRGDEDDEDYISVLRSFVSQSPALAYVHIDLRLSPISLFVTPFTSASIHTFKLDLTDEWVIGDFESLSASATPLLLPQLIHFECLIDTKPVGASRIVQSLSQVIRSRWHVGKSNTVARIQSVRISFSQRGYSATKEEVCHMVDCLQMLRAEGLSVAVFRFLDRNADAREQML